jgi:hypothetical protein
MGKIMFIVSAHSKNGGFIAAINESFIANSRLGECSIKRTHDDQVFYVSQKTDPDTVGFFIPCYTQEHAIELGIDGILVIDIDRFIDSMDNYTQEDFSRDIENDSDDNFVADEILARLDMNMSDPAAIDFLPIMYYTLRQPVLHPAQYQLLQIGQQPALHMTINTNKTVVNHIVSQK